MNEKIYALKSLVEDLEDEMADSTDLETSLDIAFKISDIQTRIDKLEGQNENDC